MHPCLQTKLQKKNRKILKYLKKKYGIDTHVMLSLIKGINDIKNKNDYN